MSTATTLPVNPSPAAVEFALLQSWLASSSTLRLPLHHIESQQADKGREVQRLLLQNHLQQPGMLTPSTASALPIRPVALCWSPRSTAKAFPLSNRWLHGRRFVSPKGRNPIRNAWPPSPPCSPARLGCAPHNKSWKVCSLPRVAPPATSPSPRVRRTSASGPACSRVRRS